MMNHSFTINHLLSKIASLFKKDSKPEKEKKPNISEPVYSFLNEFKNNRKRFKITYEHMFPNSPIVYTVFYDKVSDVRMWMRIDTEVRNGNIVCSDNISFLTQYEIYFIIEEIEKIFRLRMERFYEIKSIRRNRGNKKKRKQMCDIYVKKI